MTIQKTEHCSRCENQAGDYKTGMLCGVTNQKPAFDRTCNMALFGKHLKAEIEEVSRLCFPD